MKSGNTKINAVKRACTSVAVVGVCAATMECVKLALAAVPNVEAVTLLAALYGYCFGWLGVLSSLVFVFIEPMIYGFGSWFITYLIHWPMVSLAFFVLSRSKLSRRTGIAARRVIPCIMSLISVILFGILSSFVDISLFSGGFDNFFYRFVVYYLRGIPFYITQAVSNLVLFALVFPAISPRLSQIGKRLLPATSPKLLEKTNKK